MSREGGYSTFARYYDALTANVDYRARAAYFVSLISRYGGTGDGILLDLACGTGSLSLELAALGYEVIGADASAEMLSAAMRKAAETPHRVLFLHQDMASLDLYGTVDYTVCALDSLNHLPDEAALNAAIGRISLFTNPGGLFLFDVNTAYKHREVLADNTYVYDLDEVFCVWRNEYRPGDGGVDILLDFFERQPDGAYIRGEERFTERFFSDEAVRSALEGNGFALKAVYGDDGFNRPTDITQRILYVAYKIN